MVVELLVFPSHVQVMTTLTLTQCMNTTPSLNTLSSIPP